MAPKLPRSSEVWHGKTFVLPSPEGPEAAPLVLAIWANESDQTVVHASFTPLAKGPVRLVTSFDDATRSPLVELPRVPRRIVVENRQAADQLTRSHGVQAAVRDVPLIDEIARAALSEIASGMDAAPTSTGRVSSAAQLELQKAAALLWKAKPWETLFDTDWIVIEAPGDPLDGHVLSVIGARKEVFGFCQYPSLDEAQDFFDRAEIDSERPSRLNTTRPGWTCLCRRSATSRRGRPSRPLVAWRRWKPCCGRWSGSKAERTLLPATT